jgi:L-lysine 2,3-aminomutase
MNAAEWREEINGAIDQFQRDTQFYHSQILRASRTQNHSAIALAHYARGRMDDQRDAVDRLLRQAVSVQDSLVKIARAVGDRCVTEITVLDARMILIAMAAIKQGGV